MANSILPNNISTFVMTLNGWLREYFFRSHGFMQIGAIGVAYLIALFFSARLHRQLEKNNEKVKRHMRVNVSLSHFSTMLRYFFWLLLMWFCQVLFKRVALPDDLLHMSISLVLALMVVRLAASYLKNPFWSRFVYGICLIYIALRISRLWEPTVELLASMTIGLGKISMSIWSLTELITVFILLWTTAGAANRFMAHWLTSYTHLTYSDRTLIQRAIRAVTALAVILISLRAAGINLATVVVTGGAIGFAIGIGLQKIGSNVVSGMMLLLRKPIRQGDVIALENNFGGSDYGWVTRIGLNYVQVATRSGTRQLIPNEVFVTKTIENLSINDYLLRLKIPFGISYHSDLKKAISLTLSATKNIDRILKIPEPKCYVREFGDSAVNLELRVWINDPQNGLGNIKNALLLEIWDGFHANGIELAFPQRDLHIKSAVPLEISRIE
jgi:small-conductance mechanosensitive channel